jgi:hypothetical protein
MTFMGCKHQSSWAFAPIPETSKPLPSTKVMELADLGTHVSVEISKLLQSEGMFGGQVVRPTVVNGAF